VVVVETKNKLLRTKTFLIFRLLTFGEIGTLFGGGEFNVPFGLVGDVGEMICCVNTGRAGTGGVIGSCCFDCLPRP
jgi:hypothetical protein